MTTDVKDMHLAHEIVIELGKIRPQLFRGARMFVETVAVPTLLLFVLLHTAGLFWGMVSVIGWCALTLGVRRMLGQHLPGTLLLCAGMLCGRAVLALVLQRPGLRVTTCRRLDLHGVAVPRQRRDGPAGHHASGA